MGKPIWNITKVTTDWFLSDEDCMHNMVDRLVIPVSRNSELEAPASSSTSTTDFSSAPLFDAPAIKPHNNIDVPKTDVITSLVFLC